MKAQEFYEVTNKAFTEYANLKGIENKEKYYFYTDYSSESVYRLLFNLRDRDSISYLFAQYCYHGQNSSKLAPIVNLDSYPNWKNNKVNLLKELYCEFNIDRFINKYNNFKTKGEIAKYVYDSGLTWNLLKTNKNTKRIEPVPYGEYNWNGSAIGNYFLGILNIAKFLVGKTKKGIIEYYKKMYDKGNTLLEKITNIHNDFSKKHFLGFGLPLTCDFIKELDPYFNDLCKPDLHIKDTFKKYLEVNGRTFEEKEDLTNEETIDIFDKVLTEIKKEYPDVTGYQLDRVIYILCSGNFFIDHLNFRTDYKKIYLNLII